MNQATRTKLLGVGWRRGLGCWTLLWGARLALAWVVSRPVAVAVSAGEYADRSSFEPGGLMLLELVRLRTEPLLEALRTSTSLLVGAWVLLVVVTTSGVVLLDRGPKGEGATRWWSAAARALPRVLFVAALLVGTALLCLFVLFTVTGTVAGALSSGASPVLAELVAAGGVLLGLTLLALGGLGFDLMRVHLIRGAPSLRVALGEAGRSFRNHAGRLLAGRAAVAVASLLVVAGVAWLVGRQDLTREGTGPLLSVFVLHRLGGALLVALQVIWLALVVGACDGRGDPGAPVQP